MFEEVLILFVLAPVAGLALGFYLAHPPVLSGRWAMALSAIPYAGLFLGWVFC